MLSKARQRAWNLFLCIFFILPWKYSDIALSIEKLSLQYLCVTVYMLYQIIFTYLLTLSINITNLIFPISREQCQSIIMQDKLEVN